MPGSTAPESTGTFTVTVHEEWSPIGAARFGELLESGFFTNCKFFRVIKGFMAQFGISGDPQVARKWRDLKITDDSKGKASTAGRPRKWCPPVAE